MLLFPKQPMSIHPRSSGPLGREPHGLMAVNANRLVAVSMAVSGQRQQRCICRYLPEIRDIFTGSEPCGSGIALLHSTSLLFSVLPHTSTLQSAPCTPLLHLSAHPHLQDHHKPHNHKPPTPIRISHLDSYHPAIRPCPAPCTPPLVPHRPASTIRESFPSQREHPCR